MYSTTVYSVKHDMNETIPRARCITAHELSVNLCFAERVPDRNANDLDRGLDEYLWVRIIYCTSGNVIKIMGSI